MTKVLLAGATGYIGKHLYETLKDDMDVYALTKYPLQTEEEIHIVKGDIFVLEDVMNAMEDIDIAIYFLDPTKRSSKVNEGTFKDMNSLAADNYGRAAQGAGVKQMIYISGAAEDAETLAILRSYSTPVQSTLSAIRRKGIMANIQVSKRDDVRTIKRYKVPATWDMEKFTAYYFNFYKEMIPKVTDMQVTDSHYAIYASHQLMMRLSRLTALSNNTRQLFAIEEGLLVKKGSFGQLEFRRIKNSDEILVITHDYEPAMPWIFYKVFQSPLAHISASIFDVDMRIERFNEESANGMKRGYTK